MLHPSLAFHFAYLDPGTGSMIVQSFVGVLAGAVVFGRRVIMNAFRKVKSLFARDANAQSNK